MLVSARTRFAIPSNEAAAIADDLRRMGLPEREANFYNNEFEQGRTVVTVDTGDRQQEAYTILMRDGGYDANLDDVRGQIGSPYAIATDYGTTASMNPATTYDSNETTPGLPDLPEQP